MNRMRRIFPAIYLLLILSLNSQNTVAQHFGPIPDRYETLRQNTVSSLDAVENRVWTGPGLNRMEEGSPDIFVPVNADSVIEEDSRGRAFSLQVTPDKIMAGLGYNTETTDGSVQTALGFYKSADNGQVWEFLPFPLDPQPPEGECTATSTGPPCDIEFRYGDETYIRTRITVPQQSPPFEVDFSGETIMAAAWASGIIRSTDDGESWDRLILPPSSADVLTPNQTYQWTSQAGNETVQRYDPRFDNNLLGFGLLIDDEGRVWAGTAAGVNISENALTAPIDQIEWRHIEANGHPDGLLGNWIVNIRQQPGTDRIWMSTWNSTSSPDDRFGLVYTEDGGETFLQFLDGERVNDIGFHNGKIYAAADGGLFISGDDGDTWRRIDQIKSANTFISKEASYFSLAATNNRIWVGSSDGLAYSSDDGQTWSIIRVDMPLSGGNIYQEDAPDVDTYAYPNPYSPKVHDLVRIKYETQNSGSATLRIFDFGMNPVYEQQADTGPGAYEFTWNGTDNSGRQVATGSYIYVVDTPDGQVDGKILLID